MHASMRKMALVKVKPRVPRTRLVRGHAAFEESFHAT